MLHVFNLLRHSTKYVAKRALYAFVSSLATWPLDSQHHFDSRPVADRSHDCFHNRYLLLLCQVCLEIVRVLSIWLKDLLYFINSVSFNCRLCTYQKLVVFSQIPWQLKWIISLLLMSPFSEFEFHWMWNSSHILFVVCCGANLHISSIVICHPFIGPGVPEWLFN